jgi:hypothetical protein
MANVASQQWLAAFGGYFWPVAAIIQCNGSGIWLANPVWQLSIMANGIIMQYINHLSIQQ